MHHALHRDCDLNLNFNLFNVCAETSKLLIEDLVASLDILDTV